ncbi:MAG: hypothetical protein AB1758_18680 [Candidatus Eremiobacterota bacterium]
MKKTMLALLFLLLALPALSHGPEGHQGVPQELLKKLFPQADSFVTKTLELEGATRKSIESRLGARLEDHDLEAPAYVATVQGRSVGLAWMTDAHLKAGEVDVLVGLGLDGKVVGVVLDRSPIASLAQPSYLKQYQGLTAASAFTIGKDLTAVSGKEEASKRVAGAVRKGVVVLTVAVLKR